MKFLSFYNLLLRQHVRLLSAFCEKHLKKIKIVDLIFMSSEIVPDEACIIRNKQT